MPETEKLVINTGPLLALIAGVGDLSLLKLLYKRVLVPFEVENRGTAPLLIDKGDPQIASRKGAKVKRLKRQKTAAQRRSTDCADYTEMT